MAGPGSTAGNRFRVNVPPNAPTQQSPLQTSGGANLNLNMKIQINAGDVMRPPVSQIQPAMAAGFYGQQPRCGSVDFGLNSGMVDTEDML